MSRRDEAAIRARDEDRPVIAPVAAPVNGNATTPVAPQPSRVSLNTLSHGNENKVKNQQKDIKPENVAALREALLSVMGNADAPKEFKIEKTSNTIHVSTQKNDEVKKDNKDSHTGSLTPDDLKRILDISQ